MTQKYKTFIFVVLALYMVLGTMPAAFCNQLLQGGVETSQELPPVPQPLRAGETFNQANLPEMGTYQEWRWLPAWRAGTWHRDTQINMLPSGPETIRSVSANEPQMGDQMDAHGVIWSHVSLPRAVTVAGDGATEWQVYTQIQAIQISQEQIVQRTRFMGIVVNNQNNQIIKVLQKEEIDTFTPEKQGWVFQNTKLTAYNELGQQLGTLQAQAHWQLIHPFAPIAVDPKTGLDLHKDFKNYLTSHGWTYLVPAN